MRKVIIAVMLFAAVCMANQMQRDMMLFARLASRQTGAPWTPADIEDLYYWFDPSDTSTVITNASGVVSNWFSKGSNTGAAIGISGASVFGGIYTNDATSGLWAYHQDGTSNQRGLELPTTIGMAATGTVAHTFIGGYERLENGITSVPFGGASSAVRGNPFVHFTDNKLYFILQGKGRATAGTYGTGRAIGVYYSDGSADAADYNMRRTGVAITDLGSTFNAGSPSVVTIGFHRTTNNEFHKGFLFDLIYVPRKMTVAEIQKAEGYIAHKWGFAANLPSDHPWKDKPPTK
jgi:hypothetical protein